MWPDLAHFDVAFLPVGDGTHIPVEVLATGDDEVFAHLAVEHHGLIPSGGNGSDELGAFVFLHVVARTVAEHVEWRLKNHIFSQLTAARALAHRLGVDGCEVVFVGILHRTLGVVERTSQHADEGDGDFVGDEVALVVPLGLFEAIHTLVVEHIGVGAVEACGLVCTVEVDEEVVFGSSLGHTIVEVDNHLVVAVHKVDLEAFHAHVGIVLADMFHVLVDGGITHPKHNAHITLGTIVHQFLDVDFGHYLE